MKETFRKLFNHVWDPGSVENRLSLSRVNGQRMGTSYEILHQITSRKRTSLYLSLYPKTVDGASITRAVSHRRVGFAVASPICIIIVKWWHPGFLEGETSPFFVRNIDVSPGQCLTLERSEISQSD